MLPQQEQPAPRLECTLHSLMRATHATSLPKLISQDSLCRSKAPFINTDPNPGLTHIQVSLCDGELLLARLRLVVLHAKPSLAKKASI